MKNNGLKNEQEIIEYINTKKYTDKMNSNMSNFIKSIFEFDISGITIKAYKFADNYKPDIIITAKGFSKYISIKSGENNSVHQEHIYSFVNFLKENGIKENEINTLLNFHFNDGTKNGSGKARKCATDFIENNQDLIQKINTYFNIQKMIEIATNRILFKGEYHNIPSADYIYYGNVEKGLWANREEIINFMISSKTFSSSIHISKLYYQSLHRNLKFDKYFEYKRYYVQFKWYSIREDLNFIMSKKA